VGVTVLYVTHDQEEALTMSDRIAIYNLGSIEQIGTGADLYERPLSLFVADFVGESNIFRGAFSADAAGRPTILCDFGHIGVPDNALEGVSLRRGDPAAVVVRPEQVRVRPVSDGSTVATTDNAITGTLEKVIYLGSQLRFVVKLKGGTVVRSTMQVREGRADFALGTEVEVIWPVGHGNLLPAAGLQSSAEAAEEIGMSQREALGEPARA
jgi:putative spermidine/putrescine transport system ATP-binding protein